MPKEKNFTRNRALVTYVSEAERQFIGKIAEKFGYPSVSSFVREAVFAQIAALKRANRSHL